MEGECSTKGIYKPTRMLNNAATSGASMTDSSSQSHTHLELSALFSKAWDVFRRQPDTLILGFLAAIVGGVLTLGFAMAPLMVGYIRMLDRASRDETVDVSEVLDGMPTFVPAFLVALITTSAVVIGSIFVVLPGVVVAVVWCFALWFVALAEQAAWPSLRSSWSLVRHNLGNVLLLLLAIALANFIGSLLIVGILVTGPITLLVTTLAFRELSAS